jgi:hypothetical protein
MIGAAPIGLLAVAALFTAEPAVAPDADPAADGAAVAVAPCSLPASERPPALRCGEALDGRAPAEPSVGRQIGRATLVVPRLVTRVVFWPVVTTTDVVEHHRVMEWMRAVLTSDDGLVGVRPEFQYATSFLPSVGARLFYRRLPWGHGSELMARFRTAGPAVLLGQVGASGPDWLGLSVLASWQRRNDWLFAGNGPNSKEDLASAGQEPARYGADMLRGEVRWTRRFPGRLIGKAHGALDRRDYTTNSTLKSPSVATVFGLPPETCAALGLPQPCVNENEMPGFHNGLRVAHLGAGIGIDLRDPVRDGGGFSLMVDGDVAQGIAGDPSQFASTSVEMVVGGGINDHLLLFRGRAGLVEKLNSAPIPFEELFIPTGRDDMRGFPAGRFRGQSGLVGSAEYRWYLSAYLDATLFVDVGTVAGARFAGLDSAHWFPSVGLGFRYYKPHGPYWQAQALNGIQIAYSPEYLRLLFSLASF